MAHSREPLVKTRICLPPYKDISRWRALNPANLFALFVPFCGYSFVSRYPFSRTRRRSRYSRGARIEIKPIVAQETDQRHPVLLGEIYR